MIQTFKPRSGILQKYVDLFYVFQSEKPDPISYIAFPHVNTAISFFKNAHLQRGNHEINIQPAHRGTDICSAEILGKYTQPVFVNFTGPFEEVSVVFKPLGVSHFFKENFIDLAPNFSQELKDEGWVEFSHRLFNETQASRRIEMVELFLLDHLKEADFTMLYKAIGYLENFEENYSMEDIASRCGTTVKTFQRNFIKHMTCSPTEYKRIARFRESIQNKLISKEIKTLTKLSHESNYYDQSYFIREFKKLTFFSPQKFFDSISALEEKNIVWKIK